MPEPSVFALPAALGCAMVAAGRLFPGRGGHRPLPLVLFGPLLARFFDAESVDFYMGAGDGWLSDACGLVVCWAAFYLGINAFYHTVAPLSRAYHARKYPDAPTSAVSAPQARARDAAHALCESRRGER